MTKIFIKPVLFLLILIALLAGFLRFKELTLNPPSLNGDELSFGYSAYSVLKTGRDEFGVFLPLVFKSVGDYKNPVPAYLMILPIKILGLTDFAVRFPNALFGTLAVPIFYFFLMYVFKKRKFALVGSLFMAISAWFIFYSRFAYEPLIGSLFAFIGIWFYMKFLDGATKYLFLSAIFLILSTYTAFSTRFFAPLFIGTIAMFSVKKFKGNYKKLAAYLGVCLILALPLAYTIFFSGAATRLNMVFIGHDIEFSRHVILRYFGSTNDILPLFFFWAERYLNYLQPDLLFANGLHLTTFDNFGLGFLYIYEVPWFILGIFSFAKKQIKHKDVFLVWLLTGIIPDSLTNNQQQGGRLLHIAPIILIFTTLGFFEFIRWIKSLKIYLVRIGVVTFYSLFIVLVLIHSYLVLAVHFPREKSEYYDEGLKEAALFVGVHQNEYKEIVFDTRHGVDAPSMISNPFLYLVFYLKYDPALYQTESKTYGTPGNPNYHFDKYTFRYIDWHRDCFRKDTLFIGSPWSFPEDLAGVKILDTIYLTNGSIAYYAARSTLSCPYKD